jgi:hypothetical protein
MDTYELTKLKNVAKIFIELIFYYCSFECSSEVGNLCERSSEVVCASVLAKYEYFARVF